MTPAPHGIAVYTTPGSPLHCELCEAFMADGGYALIGMERLFEVVSMSTAADGARTLWRLQEAAHAGTA